ncbi:protein PFC0760c-like isoform X2 [Drosophila navojoa]|uniref:protein PFC0760c-like isoform X2 n=1 Tax=Drosophila navojoa TaxID=7232 RepID=UPI0008475EAB|nr:protein PFC0760c-like isoform X2 [Drosophila navojoa]
METVPEDAQQRNFDVLSNDSRGDKLRSNNTEPSNRKQSESEYGRSRDSKGMNGEEYEPNHSQRQREKICKCSYYPTGRSTRNNQNYSSYPASNTQSDYYEVDADYDRVNGRSRQEDYRKVRAYNTDVPERYQTDPSNVRRRSDDDNRPRTPTTDNYREYDSDMPERLQTGLRNDSRRTDDNYRSRPPTIESYRDNPVYNSDTRERMQTGSRNGGRRTDSNNRSRNEIYRDMPETGGRRYTCCYSKYDRAKESAYKSPAYNNDVIDDDEYNACVRQCLPKKYQSTDYNRKAYNSDNVPAVEENFRGNGNSNLKYEAEENGYERQQENRIDEYTACNSECPVHQESSRYARKYQNEEPEYQNQQAPQVNLYVTCHSECPFRQEDGSRYQDCHSLKYQIEENNYENDQNTRAEEYAASPSNQYQEDYGKTYENFNNQNDANMDCQCEESLLPVNIQSTVEQITDEINVIRYADCIPDECPAYQANIENPVDEMLDCECPTDEEELQKPKAEQPQQADMFKTNIICQCEAAVETDLDMSLKDRYTPRKESACECPEAAVNATVVSQNGIEEKNYKSNDRSPLNQKPRPPKVNRRKLCSCKPPVIYKNKSPKSPNGVSKAETSKQRSCSPAGTKARPSSKRQNRVEDDNINRSRRPTMQSNF